MTDRLQRYREMVDQLDQELGWNLKMDVRQRYAAALARLITGDSVDQRLRAIVCSYHSDHELVEALCNSQHPNHSQSWERVSNDIAAFVRKAGLAWSSDVAVDDEDLIQIARVSVARSIDSFRFESRLSTWLCQVAIRSVQRSLRDSNLQKRAARPGSLDGIDAPVAVEHHPEAIASVQSLLADVVAILDTHRDPRVKQIFVLWTRHDQSTEAIGQLVHLHPSRVRALLGEARKLLQQDPSIQAWRDHDL